MVLGGLISQGGSLVKTIEINKKNGFWKLVGKFFEKYFKQF